MAFNRDTIVARTEGMGGTPVGDDLVILNLSTNNYLALDSIGRRILELLDGPMSISGLCSRLEAEFEGSADEILSDVCLFLTELETEGLVYVAEG